MIDTDSRDTDGRDTDRSDTGTETTRTEATRTDATRTDATRTDATRTDAAKIQVRGASQIMSAGYCLPDFDYKVLATRYELSALSSHKKNPHCLGSRAGVIMKN